MQGICIHSSAARAVGEQAKTKPASANSSGNTCMWGKCAHPRQHQPRLLTHQCTSTCWMAHQRPRQTHQVRPTKSVHVHHCSSLTAGTHTHTIPHHDTEPDVLSGACKMCPECRQFLSQWLPAMAWQSVRAVGLHPSPTLPNTHMATIAQVTKKPQPVGHAMASSHNTSHPSPQAPSTVPGSHTPTAMPPT